MVVAAPADTPPLMRLHGAWLATAVAEYFRDRGKSVLLIMDSLTRFAQAQREIGLAIGEAPATKGYPPSVFARLPQLVERAGNGMQGSGSITAFYTVLAEGDDQNDPIVDAARAVPMLLQHLDRSVAAAQPYCSKQELARVETRPTGGATPSDLVLDTSFSTTRDLIDNAGGAPSRARRWCVSCSKRNARGRPPSRK